MELIKLLVIGTKAVTSDMIAPILSYSIIYGNTQSEPSITKSSTNIVITFSSTTTTLYVLDDRGVSLKSLDVTNQTFTIPTNSMLIWNADDNALVVLSNNATRNARNIVILSNYYGNTQNGFFKYLNDRQLIYNELEKYSDFQVIVGGNIPTFSINNVNKTVSVELSLGSSLYFMRNDGVEAKSTRAYAGTTFELGANQMLIWNLDYNEIVVQTNNNVRNKNNVVLLNNTSINSPSCGFFKSYFDSWYAKNYTDSKVTIINSIIDKTFNYSIVIGASYPTFVKKWNKCYCKYAYWINVFTKQKWKRSKSNKWKW